MKFLTVASSLAILTASGIDAALPDCKVTEIAGYGNCKADHFVNAPGSDVLWCLTDDDCEKVFHAESSSEAAETPPPPPEPMESEPELTISAVEEQVSASTMRAATTSAAVTVAISAMAMLC